MDLINSREERPAGEPYQIICPKCGKTTDMPESMPESPMICPHCKQTISEDYEVRYRPSKKSASFRMIALGILIIMGLLILLSAAMLILRR